MSDEQVMIQPDDPQLMQIGNVVWHSSDPDGGGPDVGISVGLGDAMLYAGEVPGLVGGWSLVVYCDGGDRFDVAATVDPEEARELIDRLALVMRRALPAAEPAEEVSILLARVEDQATEIARLTRIIQMQPPAIKPAEDVRAGALREAAENKEQLDIWAQDILEGLGMADVLKIESYEDKIEAHSVIARGIVEVLRALIPEAKP